MVLYQNRTSIKFRNEENVRQPQILTLYIGQWGTEVWAMGYRGMGHMGNWVQGYEVQGYGAHVWAMRYRGMGHMGNGAQGYGVQGYGAHG